MTLDGFYDHTIVIDIDHSRNYRYYFKKKSRMLSQPGLSNMLTF